MCKASILGKRDHDLQHCSLVWIGFQPLQSRLSRFTTSLGNKGSHRSKAQGPLQESNGRERRPSAPAKPPRADFFIPRSQLDPRPGAPTSGEDALPSMQSSEFADGGGALPVAQAQEVEDEGAPAMDTVEEGPVQAIYPSLIRHIVMGTQSSI